MGEFMPALVFVGMDGVKLGIGRICFEIATDIGIAKTEVYSQSQGCHSACTRKQMDLGSA